MTSTRARIAMMCGNTYGFRALSSTLAQQLSRLGAIDVFLLDYPAQPTIEPLVDELTRAGHIERCYFIPDNRSAWRHHAAMGALGRALQRSRPALLLVDADFMPMNRYLIAAARAHRIPVLGVQKEVPKRLLVAFDQAKGERPQEPVAAGPRSRARLGKFVRGLAFGPERGRWFARGAQELRARARRPWLYAMHHVALPLWNSGRIFRLRPVERRTQFVSDRVDAAIVYQTRVRDALRFFFPNLEVRLAQHPLTAGCRCNGSATRSKLLVVLTGPWRNYVGHDCPAEHLEAQWCRTIAKAVAVKHLAEVHIRPHPREDGPHPQNLVTRLKASGIQALVLESGQRPLRDVVCEYDGVMGPPSGALAEAAAACRRAFVVGVLGHQGTRPEAPVDTFAPDIVAIDAKSELQPAHLTRRQTEEASRPTVAELVAQWLP